MKNIKTVIINPVITLLLIQALMSSCTLLPKPIVEFPKDEMLTEHEIRFTAQKATKLIVERKYDEVRELFAPEVSHEISNKLVDIISAFLAEKGIPEDDNIFLSLDFVTDNGDMLFVNDIVYTFDNPTHDPNSNPKLTFVFLKKFGSGKLAGIQLIKKQTESKKNYK